MTELEYNVMKLSLQKLSAQGRRAALIKGWRFLPGAFVSFSGFNFMTLDWNRS
ncbi:MAG: hypothetical protein HFI29_02550 [Lachnospiraceae bacterium]|jgi:hypothetical protein|nr:hypothetical protein [Lachnospiraceae bacterium]